MSVTYLDVGQGDSAFIETSGGTAIAVDTGKTGKELEAYMKYLGKKRIDALVITHADDDHSAGAPRIMRKFEIGEVWDSGRIKYPDGFFNKVIHRSFQRGDVMETRGAVIRALHPYAGFYTFGGNEATAENNDSLVLKVTGKRSFLFAADTAEEAEEDMAHLGEWLKSDVLKVSHHGSRTSSTEAFLELASPGIAVISVGKYNTYGHPHSETIERLQKTEIYRTDLDGAVKLVETPGGLARKTYKGFRFERAKNFPAEWRNIKRLFARW